MARIRLAAGVCIGAISACIVMVVFAGPNDPPKPAQQPASALNLGGADRFMTFVSTDKPIYKPGEKVYVRAAVLHQDKHTPVGAIQQGTVEIAGPKGDVVAAGFVTFQDSVGGFSWEVPSTMPGGEYTAKILHPWSGHVPGVRKFDIRAYRAPRLKSQIVFVRDGYGPGDTVSASVHVDRAEGGVPANAKTTVIARVDGNEVFKGETKIDATGNASASFPLPKTIERGEGTLAFVIEDGGVLETASKTIPILLQTLDLTLYPEGGDLVAGVTNRVYIEAFTPAKKPADLTGSIVDSAGKEVATVKTAHEGRGRFDLVPAKGEKYTLKITQPSGIKTTYALPESKLEGVILRSNQDVIPAGEPAKLSLAAPAASQYKLTLSKHECAVATQTVDLAASATKDVSLDLPADADGVLVATVWDAKNTPLAERLIFRQPAKSVKIEIRPDKSTYVPGEPVKLTVTTRDESGKPIAAVVGVTVTDDSVLEMIEKREQAPRLPVMVLLEADVKDLADAHVYLDPANPKAPLATDLLLGTQGWRRFAFVKTAEFLDKHGDAARRVLAMRVVTATDVITATGGAVLMDAPGMEGARRPMVMPMIPKGAKFKADGGPDDKAARPVENAPEKKAEEKAAVVAENAKKPDNRPVAAAPPVPQPSVPEPRADKDLAARLGQAQEREQNKLIAAKEEMAAAQRNDMILIREYAHAVRPDRKPGDRLDFTETLYWNAGVKTDAATGQATVSFALSDAVTSSRVFGEAFTSAGALGSSAGEVRSIQPFYAEVKMPLEVTQGDSIQLPIVFVNSTNDHLPPTAPQPTGPKGIRFGPIKPISVPAQTRARFLQYVGIDDIAGSFDIKIAASGGSYADTVTRKLKVAPRGFPVEFARGGLLGPSAAVTYEIEIPKELVASSCTSELAVYPTPLANLTQALEALIQSPSGCFEQTSSTCYPLVMAQQYFMSHQGIDPKLIERSRTLLDEGYQRLIGFECKKTKGFEWFGADPGHDALSAYGLLEFTDMALVRQVDKVMLDNTRKFVLGLRDGKGGYKRETHTLHTWISDPECNFGYITWALLECGTDPKDLAGEIAWAREDLPKSANSYALALGANILYLANERDAAKLLMDKLAKKQVDSGLVDGSTQSVIGSGGEALQIETTALATLAWLRDPSYAGNVEKAMKWLCEMSKNGRFGSTQSTILALRAIVTYDKLRARPKAPGTVQVLVDGHPMGPAVSFDDKTTGAIKLQDVSEMMSPGKHTIVLKMDQGAAMPFSLAVKYNTLKPNSSDACKLTLSTTLHNTEINEGEITEAVATITNKTDATIPTPIAIVGIPGGLEVRHDQLKELVKSGKIAAYEVIGRDVVLYWRALQPKESVEIPLSLTASIPGTYTAPASRAYLYYTDEHKTWTPPLGVTIKAK